MIKKTYTYTDYNDVERTEDFYFHLTNAELLELETGTTGGYTTMINRIIASQDTPTIMKTFKELILMSYGVKSADGRQFIKNEEVRKAFEQTEAFSMLYMELMGDDVKASEFIEGIIPKKLREEYEKQKKSGEIKALESK